MLEIIQFNTKRLILRQWQVSDYEPFSKLNADPKVMAFFPSMLSTQESNTMAKRCQTLISERGWGLWAVELKTTNEFIGFVGLHIPTANLPFSPCVEIGWRLAAEFWGNGYATEAASGALRIGFETLNLSEIVSFTALVNKKSQGVMERIGMHNTLENFEHPSILQDSPLRPHCLYRLSFEQWKQQQV
jgi:RimJ/RimL family protein N-acetyltransferase